MGMTKLLPLEMKQHLITMATITFMMKTANMIMLRQIIVKLIMSTFMMKIVTMDTKSK
jgi:hypothetical protein